MVVDRRILIIVTNTDKFDKVGKMLMFLYYLKTHYLIHVKSLSQP